jgi:ubiquinone/menaquinone biosynthesis C-methylase UbiE
MTGPAAGSRWRRYAARTTLEGEQSRIRSLSRAYAGSPRRRRAWDPDRRGNRRILTELYDTLAQVLRAAGAFPAEGRNLLDVGCGTGPLLEALMQRGAPPASLHGVDLVEDVVATAERRLPGADLRVADARALPYPSRSMDAVVMSTVLSSILDPRNRLRVGTEARRVLRPHGCVVVYDFRVPSPGNRHVRPMTTAALRRAFPDCTIQARSLTVLPQLARSLGQTAEVMYPLLAAVPLLRTHLLSVIRPREPDEPAPA